MNTGRHAINNFFALIILGLWGCGEPPEWLLMEDPTPKEISGAFSVDAAARNEMKMHDVTVHGDGTLTINPDYTFTYTGSDMSYSVGNLPSRTFLCGGSGKGTWSLKKTSQGYRYIMLAFSDRRKRECQFSGLYLEAISSGIRLVDPIDDKIHYLVLNRKNDNED